VAAKPAPVAPPAPAKPLAAAPVAKKAGAAAPVATKAAPAKVQQRRPAIVPPKPVPRIPPEEALLERAQRAINTGEEEQAERLLEKMIGDFPDDPRGRIYLGNLKRRRGDLAGALDEYTKVLRKNSKEPHALWAKGELHLAQKPEDLPSAVAVYTKIVKSFGRKKDERSKQFVEGARKWLRYCDARKLSLQGRRLLSSSDARVLKKGRDIFTKALEIYPEDARNHMNLGVAHLVLADTENAETEKGAEKRQLALRSSVRHCQEAIQRNPRYARAHLMLGRALRKLGRLKPSKESFIKCIDLDRSGRDAQDAWNERGEVEREMRRLRTTLYQALAGRPGPEGERVRLTLAQMKQMVGMLEGDDIDGADLTYSNSGTYALTAYSQRNRYRIYPGPESLVCERNGQTA
ncbi:tetratricopeptide repeat protein, partial [bacterium]|nr:tetratricopeptide repeat protein [bacterium]